MEKSWTPPMSPNHCGAGPCCSELGTMEMNQLTPLKKTPRTAPESGGGSDVKKKKDRKAYSTAGRPRVRGEYKCGKCGFMPKKTKHNCEHEKAKNGGKRSNGHHAGELAGDMVSDLSLIHI